MPKKNPDLIRPGSWVKVVDPLVVDYVGYPKHPKQFTRQAEQFLVSAGLIGSNQFCTYNRSERKLIDQLAYHFCYKERFGGNERKVHLKSHPMVEIDQILYVYDVKYAKEGTRTYEGPEEGYSFYPKKTCKLLEFQLNSEFVLIPASHVVKVNKPAYW